MNHKISIDELKQSLKLTHVVDQLIEFGVCRDVCSLIVQYARPFVVAAIYTKTTETMFLAENEDDFLTYDAVRDTVRLEFPVSKGVWMTCGNELININNNHWYESEDLDCSIGIVDCIPIHARCNYELLPSPHSYSPIGVRYSKYVKLKLMENSLHVLKCEYRL